MTFRMLTTSEYYFESLKGRLFSNDAKLTDLDLYGLNNIEDISTLHDGLCRNNTLETLYFWNTSQNTIGINGLNHLMNGLKHNKSLKELYLSNNNIGNEGATLLSEWLLSNESLTHLYIASNSIGNDGTKYLAESLIINSTLIILNLCQNSIGDDGAKTLASCIRVNETLVELYLVQNNIKEVGGKELVKAIGQNVTLTELCVYGNYICDEVCKELKVITRWNLVGPLSHDYQLRKLLAICEDRVHYTLLVLHVLPIMNNVCWHILGMLRVRDFLVDGERDDSSSWIR